jgi:hypothetical protein
MRNRLCFVLTPALLAAGHYTVLAEDVAPTISVGVASGTSSHTLKTAPLFTGVPDRCPDLPAFTFTASSGSDETTTG